MSLSPAATPPVCAPGRAASLIGSVGEYAVPWHWQHRARTPESPTGTATVTNATALHAAATAAIPCCIMLRSRNLQYKAAVPSSFRVFKLLRSQHWQVEFWAVGQVRRAGAGGPLARAWPGTIDVLTSGTFSAPILQSPIRHYTLSTGRPRCRWAGSSPDRAVDIFDAAAALRRFIHPAAREGDQAACAHTTRAPNLNDEKNSYSAFEGSSWYGTVYNLHWHKMITILMQIKIGIDFQIGFIAISRAATLLLKFKMD